MAKPGLTTDHAARKAMPITTGVIDYFPLALAAVAIVSKAGNDQHNPGEALRWAREKSIDHADCIARHLIGRGTLDSDGQPHSAKLAWRALALLETELELAQGYDAVKVAKQKAANSPFDKEVAKARARGRALTALYEARARADAPNATRVDLEDRKGYLGAIEPDA